MELRRRPGPVRRGAPGYLGIDLGTGSLKASLFGPDGRLVAGAEQAYSVRSPRPGYAEIDPARWASALRSALERLADVTSDVSVLATGLTGQMHGVVLVDAAGRPVRTAMLWPDQRAASVLPRWESLPRPVRGALSNPLVAGMAGPMLTWLAAHEPETLAATAVVLSPKDWLRRRLTGDVSTERSDASATLLWDVTSDGWSEEAVALAGVHLSQLPDVVASDAVVGHVGKRAREVPVVDGAVVAGAADTAAALLPLRRSATEAAWTDGTVVNTGSGIQVVRPQARPRSRVAPQTHLYADAAGGWYEMLAIQNGGLALAWTHRVLGVSWEEAVAAAHQAAPGAAGAVFTPFLTGERGEIAASGANAGWSGLSASTGRAELLRAAFESYAFLVRRGVELVDAGSAPVVLTGGGGREPWLRQLLADVLGRPVRYVALRSASAAGAAMLAARAVGSELPVPADVIEVEPAGSTREPLEAAYQRWRAVTAR